MRWKDIWTRKGHQDTTDLRLLNGYEDTSIDERMVTEKISNTLGITKESRVLEVGCGAGMLAQHLDCDYTGVDYSSSLVKKHIEILGNKVFVSPANDLKFQDHSFDFAFSYSVFHYFEDHEYAREVIREMERVAKKGIFVGDIPVKSHRKEHLLYGDEHFVGWNTEPGYYNPDRFNVWKLLEDA
tara:strand:- start:1172 stop:1723 length:552 start_codon:yes stop_codon:yes gene_type:complete